MNLVKKQWLLIHGSNAQKIIEMVNVLNVKVKYIVLTHCHVDHIMAASELKEKTRW